MASFALAQQRFHEADLFVRIFITQQFFDRFEGFAVNPLEGIRDDLVVSWLDQPCNVDGLTCFDELGKVTWRVREGTAGPVVDVDATSFFAAGSGKRPMLKLCSSQWARISPVKGM